MGIEISGSDSIWGILDGTNVSGTIETATPPRLPLPVSGLGEIDNLLALRNQFRDLIVAKHVDTIGIIKAAKGSSVIRAKIECMIQLAAKESGAPCELVSVNTVNAASKRKIAQIAGKPFEEAFGKVQPGYLERCLHCAWSVLNERL